MKNILVIGGTYFLGKCFLETLLREGICSEEAADEEIMVYVLNRGSVPMERPKSGKPIRLQSLRADRHDGKAMAAVVAEHLAEKTLDAVVDFCGYSEGDICSLFDCIYRADASISQYLFVSTVDVYRRGTGKDITEEAPYENRDFGGDAGAYILGKVALEAELKSCCANYGSVWTILRPAVIYGPGNYAPREGIYFHWIRQAGQIIHPTDATGFFQLVYVGDAAEAIRLCLQNPIAYNKAYNICRNTTLTYEDFANILTKATQVAFDRVEITVQEATEQGIPLPFPLSMEESEHYIGDRAKELGISFTDVISGMEMTYRSFCEAH